MNRRDKKPTLAPTAIDAIVVALSPALIIGMVSCLVFFLVVAFYRGEFDQRLMYILGLFTLATVLIARIAIESGRTYANAFSLPLAIVSVIAMFRFVTIAGPLGPISPLINIVLLGVAWYLADRITFDCTSVDERDSGVQQGLLQSLGLLKKETLPKASSDLAATAAAAATATAAKDSTVTPQAKSPGTAQAKKKNKKRHNPGVWVLYFSLLAFPLFGLGQLTIPDDASRSTAFYLLVGYLGCALALLSTTSFISTRRYLRHRGASMPAEMSRSWLGYAGVGIVALLVICLLLPLPGRSLGLVGLPFELKSPDGLQTSRWGWGDEGVQPSESEAEADEASDSGIVRADAKDKGNAAGAPQPDGKGKPQASDQAQLDASSASGDRGKSENGNSQGNTSQENPSDSKSSDPAAEKKNSAAGDSQKGDSQKGDSQTGDAASEQQSSDKQSSDQQPSDQQSGNDDKAPGDQPENRDDRADAEKADAEKADASEQAAEEAESQAGEDSKQEQATSKTPPPTSSPSSNGFNWLPTGLADIIKWLTIAVLALIVILYAITHPREVLQQWRDFLDFIARLFGRRSPRDTAAASGARQSAAATAAMRPFRSFANPFANQLQGWTPEQAIHQTFAALEAWAAEQGRRRQRDETAAEFAKHLGRRIPSVDSHAATAARMLDSLMFAGWKPTTQEIAPLAKVWQALVDHAKNPLVSP